MMSLFTVYCLPFRRPALSIILSALLLAGCRNDAEVFEPEAEQAGQPEKTENIVGFYLLNQGNMGSNKATLDYYDYSTAT